MKTWSSPVAALSAIAFSAVLTLAGLAERRTDLRVPHARRICRAWLGNTLAEEGGAPGATAEVLAVKPGASRVGAIVPLLNEPGATRIDDTLVIWSLRAGRVFMRPGSRRAGRRGRQRSFASSTSPARVRGVRSGTGAGDRRPPLVVLEEEEPRKRSTGNDPDGRSEKLAEDV